MKGTRLASELQAIRDKAETGSSQRDTWILPKGWLLSGIIRPAAMAPCVTAAGEAAMYSIDMDHQFMLTLAAIVIS